MRLRFLGTGTSHGVPVVGCHCPVCASSDPRDARYRSSIVVEDGETRVLVDSGPEFRLQAIRAGLDRVDALMLTHAHADHVHGLDDLRPLSRRAPIPVYGNRETLAELRERFAYAFGETLQEGGGKPRFDLREIPPEGVEIGSLRVLPLPVSHGLLPILGFRIGPLAYLTDCSGIPDGTRDALRDIRVLVIDGLRKRPHPTHFSLDQAARQAMELGVKEAYITHICHDHSHEELESWARSLPGPCSMRIAYDGLTIEL